MFGTGFLFVLFAVYLAAFLISILITRLVLRINGNTKSY